MDQAEAMTVIGKRLRAARGTMSTVAACAALGISREGLANYEEGKRDPRGTLILRAAITYGTTVGHLLGEDLLVPAVSA